MQGNLQTPASSRCSTPSRGFGPTPSPLSIRQASWPRNMATAWRPWTTTAAPLHCTASPLQTLALRMQPHKSQSRARPTAYPPSKRSWRGSSNSAWPSDNSSHHPTTSTTPPNSNSIVTTTAGTTMEAEAAAATKAMVAATRNNQPCTKANKVVAMGLCVPPRPTSDGRIGPIAIRMAVMSKTPTRAPRAPDEAPSTTRMPRAPTPWAAHRQGCTRRSYLLHPAVPHLPPANSNNSSNVLQSPTTPCWQCPLLSKAPP
jgi:hypothetical protein